MVSVLRLGHRIARDKRISTHCGLVSRAFGAKEMLYSGEKDGSLERSVKDVAGEWGGPFGIRHVKNWRGFIRGFRGRRVHLTMYGLPIQKKIREIRKSMHVLVIIGGEKVPGDAYRLADFNVSVTNQPHSEVAALAVFLHEFFEGRELEKRFRKVKRRIIPQERGKKLIQI
jgi:tRNA (cytidine56-2'-O)-methyltransferase